MSNITVRDVNDEVFRDFKAEATKQGMTVGQALTFAMMKFKGELGKPKEKFSSLKPTSWGKGTEYLSEKMDDVLYGEKK